MSDIQGTLIIPSTEDVNVLRGLVGEFTAEARTFYPKCILTHEADWNAGGHGVYPGNITPDVINGEGLVRATIKLYGRDDLNPFACFDVFNSAGGLTFSVDERLAPSLRQAAEKTGGSILILN